MKKIVSISLLLTAIVLSACSGKEKENNNVSIKVNQATPVEVQAEEEEEYMTPLYELSKKYDFKFGACISYNDLANKKYLSLLKNDFNTTTATNEFKAYSLLDQTQSQIQKKPVMNYKQADKIAAYAQENGIGMRGHVLVWDAYMTNWFFKEGFSNNGNYVSKAEMEERLSYYIDEVITHFETNFPGLVYCWDVVNEAVADNKSEAIPGNSFNIRATRGGTANIFYETMGEDYVLFAFKCARNTVKKLGADIKLFYNDYNTFYPEKRNHICALIEYLNKKEKLCDGVGMQGYIGGYGQQAGCMNPSDLALIKASIKKYSDLGIEVQLTEVAVRNYNNDDISMSKHASFYGDLINTIIEAKKDGANFTGLTIWGICDNPTMSKSNYSYKMNGPFCGLYTKECKRKDSYLAVHQKLE